MTEQPVEEREEGKERPHHDYDDGDEMTTEANLQAIIQALPIEQRTIHYVMACALYICRIEVGDYQGWQHAAKRAQCLLSEAADEQGPCAAGRLAKKTSYYHHSSSSSSSSPRPSLYMTEAVNAIASFLINNDLFGLMGTSQWLMKAYGKSVRNLKLRDVRLSTTSRGRGRIIVSSVLNRLPLLKKLSVAGDESICGLAEVIVKDGGRHCCLPNLQALEVRDIMGVGRHNSSSSSSSIALLFNALAGGGALPQLDHMALKLSPNTDTSQVLSALGAALSSRMMHAGCSHLKSLNMEFDDDDLFSSPWVGDLSPLLCDSACDSLEELQIERLRLKDEAIKDLTQWLRTTKAIHLRLFRGRIREHLASALSAVPSRQTLGLHIVDTRAVPHLCKAFESQAWPQLRELSVVLDYRNEAGEAKLVDAICAGASQLQSVRLEGNNFGPYEGMALARGLQSNQGGCRQLESLDVLGTRLGDVGVTEVAKALSRGAPCSVSLRMLSFRQCKIGMEGVKGLARAFMLGACPSVERLDLSLNPLSDDGVKQLAEAMQRDDCLTCLHELHLERVGMTPAGALILLEHSGGRLKKLNMVGNDLKDGVMKEVVGSMVAQGVPVGGRHQVVMH